MCKKRSDVHQAHYLFENFHQRRHRRRVRSLKIIVLNIRGDRRVFVNANFSCATRACLAIEPAENCISAPTNPCTPAAGQVCANGQCVTPDPNPACGCTSPLSHVCYTGCLVDHPGACTSLPAACNVATRKCTKACIVAPTPAVRQRLLPGRTRLGSGRSSDAFPKFKVGTGSDSPKKQRFTMVISSPIRTGKVGLSLATSFMLHLRQPAFLHARQLLERPKICIDDQAEGGGGPENADKS